MTGVFLKPGDLRWTNFLRTVPHDVYHLPDYATLASRSEKGRPVAFYLRDGEDAILTPLLFHKIPPPLNNRQNLWEAASPYGYPGPLFSRPDRADACSRLLAALVRAVRDRGLVTLFLRLHPLLSCPLQIFSQQGELVQHGHTVNIDLNRPETELLEDIRENHQRDLRKLSQCGFHVVLNAWDSYPEFIRLYRQTMHRVNATPFYFFEGTYFDDLRRLLREHLLLCAVFSPKGELAAAGLFTVTNGLVEYHLGASRKEYLKYAPSKLLFDFMRRWARERGLKSLHLGGGRGAKNDSLFAFKAGFSSTHHPFHTFRLVLAPSTYSALCRAWEQQTGCQGKAGGRFPPYRTP